MEKKEEKVEEIKKEEKKNGKVVEMTLEELARRILREIVNLKIDLDQDKKKSIYIQDAKIDLSIDTRFQGIGLRQPASFNCFLDLKLSIPDLKLDLPKTAGSLNVEESVSIRLMV